MVNKNETSAPYARHLFSWETPTTYRKSRVNSLAYVGGAKMGENQNMEIEAGAKNKTKKQTMKKGGVKGGVKNTDNTRKKHLVNTATGEIQDAKEGVKPLDTETMEAGGIISKGLDLLSKGLDMAGLGKKKPRAKKSKGGNSQVPSTLTEETQELSKYTKPKQTKGSAKPKPKAKKGKKVGKGIVSDVAKTVGDIGDIFDL